MVYDSKTEIETGDGEIIGFDVLLRGAANTLEEIAGDRALLDAALGTHIELLRNVFRSAEQLQIALGMIKRN